MVTRTIQLDKSLFPHRRKAVDVTPNDLSGISSSSGKNRFYYIYIYVKGEI